MTRVAYNTHDCADKGAPWSTTPCLCDCHYRGGAPCGDIDAASQPRRIRVRRTERPHRSDWR